MIFLSHILNQNTPTYGNKNRFECVKKSDIAEGAIANDSYISSTVHIGTHIDMPYHFYEEGQTIEDFEADFWLFTQPLIVEIQPKSLIIKDELLAKLSTLQMSEFDILIVKTGICHAREEERFWSKNYGFHPDIYDYLVEKFPKIRVFGFDSISVSSFKERLLGREAHKRFLNPDKPILLLEDMNLANINENRHFSKIIVAPLRIQMCDGLPCTVFGFLND